VAALPPASRAVVSLHYFADLPLDEVADVLGVPLGTVKSRLAYGLSRLRRETETSR
jgi:RNA polymerase sigma-70 factor (ECF subfamily)